MVKRTIQSLAILLFATMLLASCAGPQPFAAADDRNITTRETTGENMTNRPTNTENRQVIYLAGGCFWGVEAYFDRVPGVLETESGYANGRKDETSYYELADTGHAETVKVTYDSNRIHLAELLDRYYLIIEPFSLNKQGNDVGEQYRIGIYYSDDNAKEISELSHTLFEESLGKETVIELEPLEHFITAEEYHQNYLDKNPNGYCHVNLNTSATVLYPGQEKPDDDTLKKDLSDLAYNVTQEKGTERAYTSEYDDFYESGIYVDVITGQPLFASTEKYDAGCGWPSFTRPITTDVMEYNSDTSFGMNRVEVETLEGKNHLGHIFEDGLKDEGGLRYCMNGAALRFIPEEDMRAEGYASLLPYLLG